MGNRLSFTAQALVRAGFDPGGDSMSLQNLMATLRDGNVDENKLVDGFVQMGAVDVTDQVLLLRSGAGPLACLTRGLARRHQAIPVRVDGHRITVAMLDPSHIAGLEEMSEHTGLVVEPCVCAASILWSALDRFYRNDDAPLMERSSVPLMFDLRPAQFEGVADPRLVAQIAADPIHRRSAQDSLPPQVLSSLLPPARMAVLFLVRGDVAVGWGAQFSRTDVHVDVRDVLIPLTAPGLLGEAKAEQRVAVFSPRATSVTERAMMRFLKHPLPRAAIAVPVIVRGATIAVLYVDRDNGALDAVFVDDARRAGIALAEAMSPFAATGGMFADVSAAAS
jgi:Type II secretion system (T2SS), protein E, N-terminal domain